GHRDRERVGPATSVPERDRRDEPRQDQVPQEQRPLVGRPERQHLEERGCRPARVLSDVGDGEVVREDRGEHRPVRRRHDREERERRGAGALDEHGPVAAHADDGCDQAVHGKPQGEDERERAESVHAARPAYPPPERSAELGVTPGAGGVYKPLCFTSSVSEWNTPSAPYVPSRTTPRPSLKRAGTAPVLITDRRVV